VARSTQGSEVGLKHLGLFLYKAKSLQMLFTLTHAVRLFKRKCDCRVLRRGQFWYYSGLFLSVGAGSGRGSAAGSLAACDQLTDTSSSATPARALGRESPLTLLAGQKHGTPSSPCRCHRSQSLCFSRGGLPEDAVHVCRLLGHFCWPVAAVGGGAGQRSAVVRGSGRLQPAHGPR